jgi:hypothetical protein
MSVIERQADVMIALKKDDETL